MRVRALDANGDMQFGGGSANFLVNSPEAVAQNVQTALGLQQGEWFLDTTAGVPYQTKVLGRNTSGARDQVIRAAILGVQGVTGIVSYSSTVAGRGYAVEATISTAYGEATISTTILSPAAAQALLQPSQLDFSKPANSAFIELI